MASMISAITPQWLSGTGPVAPDRGAADLEAMRARVGHDVAAGHCGACDGFLEVQARSAASGMTPAMAGVAVGRAARAEDRVSISPAGRAAALRGTESAIVRSRSTEEVERALDVEALDPVIRGSSARPTERDSASEPGPRPPDELALEELRQLAELQARDREVRAHEQAHKAVAGPHGGAVSFDYQTGPDGRKYAVGGEVAVDVSPVRGDPQATIEKMEQVRRAALAPAEPSSTDRAVASRAAALAEQAQAELRAERADAPAPAATGAAETERSAGGTEADPSAAAPERRSGLADSRIAEFARMQAASARPTMGIVNLMI
jgi:hypothetical protein